MHVLGTAGHVDHGKSTLIHALTGIDPDRLEEEKARGLTIDLGFAWMTLPGGREAGIVDVPGHERFVHNMLAGVGSIDATIFVVAANEGWRPQSEEHLQIIDLLGARGGVVALTKADLVDAATLERATEQVRRKLGGTTLHDAEIVALSATTGDGLDDLRDAIDRMLDATPPAVDAGRPRLFVDRSFTIRGAGTVVTGTLTGGALRVDDEIEVRPAGVRARIRGMQTHRRGRDGAEPGSRVALNLAGLERHEIVRGDAVVKPGHWYETTTLDVELRPVRSVVEPITARGAYKLYLGAAETECRLTLLDAETLAPGGTAFARLRSSEPVVATELDRFVLRDTGRRATVAGGRVLDAHPSPARVPRAELLERLRERAAATPERIASLAVAGRGAVPLRDLIAIAGTAHPPDVVMLGSYAAASDWLHARESEIEAVLRGFHDAEPLAKGMPRDDARKASGFEDARLFAEIVEHASDRITGEGPLLRLGTHAVRLSSEQETARKAALEGAHGFAPPSLKDLQAAHGAKLIAALLDAGDLVKATQEMAFTRDSIEDAKRILAHAVRTEGPLTTSRIRELLGTSRKFAIPLLEYLDANGFTRRDGDVRSVRDG